MEQELELRGKVAQGTSQEAEDESGGYDEMISISM